MKKILLFLLLVVAAVPCKKPDRKQSTAQGGALMKINLTSSAFAPDSMIPSKYTCDGEDISPPLAWDTVPEGTKSLALISDDPDAPMGTWVHWVVYNLPAAARSLPENVPPYAVIEDGGEQGTNDFGNTGYGGPCPPGGTHRYFFKLYALDTELSLSGKARKKDVEKAMQGHVLGQGELMGRYRRR
jgi:Raf kinase inhibitor-like YbhB/YbcL family protein